MHLRMPECHISFLGHCDLDLSPCFKKYCVQSISLIFFEVGIPNLVCVYASWDGRMSDTIFGSL